MVSSILNVLKILGCFGFTELLVFFPNLVLKSVRKSLNDIALLSVGVQKMKKFVLSQKLIDNLNLNVNLNLVNSIALAISFRCVSFQKPRIYTK